MRQLSSFASAQPGSSPKPKPRTTTLIVRPQSSAIVVFRVAQRELFSLT